MFIVYDARGRIAQTIVGPDPKTYGPILAGHGMRWIFEKNRNDLDVAKWWVDPVHKFLRMRVPFAGAVSKTVIKADDMDSATISNIPPGTVVTVRCNSAVIATKTVNNGRITITSPVPALFEVSFDPFPHLPTTITIEAVA